MLYKRVILFICLCVICQTLSADTFWFSDGDPANSLWNTAANWSNSSVPIYYDYVEVGAAGGPDETHVPVIDANHVGGSAAVCGKLDLGFNTAGNFALDMTGGSFEAFERIILCSSTTASMSGTFNLYGGTVETPVIEGGSKGYGIFNIYDGTLDVTNKFFAGVNNYASTSGVVNQAGGEVNITNYLIIPNYGKGIYNISGGTLDIGVNIEGGLNETSSGIMNISGGTVNVGNKLWCGSEGDFTLNMTGGILNIGIGILAPTNDLGGGTINLHGGTITVNDILEPLRLHENGRGHLDIRNDGTLILAGDNRIKVGNYRSFGWITAYGGRGKVIIDYDFINDVTTVHASSVDAGTAYDQLPEEGASVYGFNPTLQWSAGDGAMLHDVYLSTSFNDVNSGALAAFKDTVSDTNYPVVTSLLPGTTYYWRIDEINPNAGTTENLIGWWKFDESSGFSASDSSGYDNTATVTGAAWTAGEKGNCLAFNGSDYVTVPADAFSSISDQVTISLWQYGDPAYQPQNDNIMQAMDASNNRVFGIMIPWDTEKIIWDAGGASSYDRLDKLATSPDIYEGQWNHWAFTKNVTDGTMKIYLNGKLWASGISRTKPIGTVANFKIGSAWNGTYNYDGMIDDFRVYNRELSAEEIEQIYQASGVEYISKGRIWSFNTRQTTANTDYYVAPTGDDNNPGTIALPFATITKARDVIRSCESLPTGGVAVWLRGGTYSITKTIAFDQYDSGEPNKPITYSAYPGEKPVISSGINITGWSQVAAINEPAGLPAEASGNLWVADIPGGLGCFKMLYDGMEKLPRAQGPGFEPSSRCQNSKKWKKTMYFPAGALKNWSNLHDVEIKIIPKCQFVMDILPLEIVDEVNNVATTSINGSFELWDFTGDNFDIFGPMTVWVENVPEALNQPGEWIVNTQTGKVYLWPKESAPSADIVAPSLKQLICVEGNENTDTVAEYINFKGITFAHAERDTWNQTDPSIQHEWLAYDKADAIVRLRWADNCTIEKCTFTSSGSSGVRLDQRCQYDTIKDSEFNNLGGTAIFLCGVKPGLLDINKYNQVINNHIHHIGQEYWDSIGIALFQSGSNYIAYNAIHDVPHIGIYLGGHRWPYFNPHKDSYREPAGIRFNDLIAEGVPLPMSVDDDWMILIPYSHARNNLIEYNEFVRTCQKLGDTNAMYMTAGGRYNVIRKNYCHDTYTFLAGAIRTDGFMDMTTIEKNIICRILGRGMTVKDRNYWNNNIIADLLHIEDPSIIRWGYIAFVDGPKEGSTVQKNIFYHKRRGEPVLYYENSDMVPWEDQNDVVNYNLYCWDNHRTESLGLLASQQAKGADANSIADDPMFADIDAGDFTLSPTSPAITKLGFEPIDFENIGLKLKSDIDRSGTVDMSDFALFAQNWQNDKTFLLRPEIDHQGSIARWAFDEDTDDAIAIDRTGNGYDAIITGAKHVEGRSGVKALDFEGTAYVTVDPNVFSAVTNQVSFCLWQYGDPNYQPQEDSIFQGNSAAVKRIFNVHLPWSNENVIWDCGDDTGYDRLEKQVTDPNEYMGKWNHWVFTKNVTTGSMKIYLNAELWAEGSNFTKPIGNIASFAIGANATGTLGYYDGMIDDFRVYNYELTADEVAEIYYDAMVPTAFGCSEYLPGDLNYDCKVDMIDLAMITAEWLESQL